MPVAAIAGLEEYIAHLLALAMPVPLQLVEESPLF